METELFRMQGNEIFSVKSGKLVATLDEAGEYHLEKGMYSYTEKLEEYLGYQKTSPVGDTLELLGTDNTASIPVPEELEAGSVFVAGSPAGIGSCAVKRAEEEVPATPEAMLVYDIPVELLPKLDAALGVETPAFKQFVKYYRVDEAQIPILVKRILEGK